MLNHKLLVMSLHCAAVLCHVVQLVSHCVDVLVTAFKDTIIAECPQMIKNNETESESCMQSFCLLLSYLHHCMLCQVLALCKSSTDLHINICSVL